ncbi:hypothetical protein ACKGJY_10215 [Hyunsoonleella sp. 2307UL5-6]|uniref:hypothetical protein n=1 Tax=Hyunsoonleella sp. 2307UL5-6 TaxID=3384768 RepID=UPI0039BC965B
MIKKLKTTLTIIICILYLGALLQECYLVDGHSSIGSFGVFALLLGWMQFDTVALVWLANPLFVVSLLLFVFSKKLNLGLILSGIASILAIYFLNVTEVLRDESGYVGKITGYLLGYWMWVSANVLCFFSFVLKKWLNKKQQ